MQDLLQGTLPEIQHFKRPSVKVAVWFMKRSDNLAVFLSDNPDLARDMFDQFKQIDKTILQKITLYLQRVSNVEFSKMMEIMETISPKVRDAFVEAREQLSREDVQKAISQTAMNMIRKGSDNDFIVEVTGLSVDEVKHLRKSLG